MEPFCSPLFLTFLKHYRAAFIMPCIRGGGELGEDHHLEGTKERKVS